MLRSLKDLENYGVSASDGEVGKVANFLFDDERWVVRHLVVDTGGFLHGRHAVIISPISIRVADWASRRIYLALTTEKIVHSPGVDTDRPVSRQHEWEYYRYYDYLYYWAYPGVWGMGSNPVLLAESTRYALPRDSSGRPSDDVHLRSAHEVRGYHVHGRDEAIGHIDDMVVDDETWEVRYLVIDTRNWWFGKKVLVSPQWASRINWLDRTVHFDMTRQAIKNSPEWNPDAGVNREYETRLYDYYGRPLYWEAGLGQAQPPSEDRDAW